MSTDPGARPSAENVAAALRGRLIVSCQAPEQDPFRDPDCIARFAAAAWRSGAGGIRANGAEDVRAIRQVVPDSLPIIGLDKRRGPDGKTLITPCFEGARAVQAAGAGIIALDCTVRGRRFGQLELLRRLKSELGVLVMADIATTEEAVAAVEAGADFVGSTMRGYTEETAGHDAFEPAFIAELARAVRAPIIAEGHVWTPAEARAAMASGALAVVVGTAITNPGALTGRFARALETEARRKDASFLGIDLGGTRTKFGVVSAGGEMIVSGHRPTPAGDGQAALLRHLETIAKEARALALEKGLQPAALGVATAGWVDPASGQVIFASDNLPGWTGARVAETLATAIGLPVAVENDANALAVGEKHFGLARETGDFACLSLGTGVGGGCYVNGRLVRGAHFLANALGHICVEEGGLPCTCGRQGCLEAYANSQALLRYAHGTFASAETLISAANGGDAAAREAIRVFAGYLATGVVSLMHVLDPGLIVLAGGLTQNNPLLLAELREQVARRAIVWNLRRLRLEYTGLGYHGGVFGACAVAREKIDLTL